MMSEFERELWGMLYKSQIALAKQVLKDMNDTREDKGDWPLGMAWNECNGSSHAIFFRRAREIAGIDSDRYLEILRGSGDALEIAERELEAAE